MTGSTPPDSPETPSTDPGLSRRALLKASLAGGAALAAAPLFGGIFVAMLAASYIYAKGYDGGSGLAEGMRFGIVAGLLVIGYAVIVGYATMNLGPRHTGLMALAALVEWMIAGVVIGLVYKPSPGATRRAAGV